MFWMVKKVTWIFRLGKSDKRQQYNKNKRHGNSYSSSTESCTNKVLYRVPSDEILLRMASRSGSVYCLVGREVAGSLHMAPFGSCVNKAGDGTLKRI